MSAAADIRLDVGFMEHLKTKALRRAVGSDGVLCLLQLWCWAARERPTGELTGITVEVLEAGVDWPEDRAGEFVEALLRIGFLDKDDNGIFHLHDWLERQPWVLEAHRKRAEGRFHAHRGKAKRRGESDEAAIRYAHEQVPEYGKMTGRKLDADLAAIPPVQPTLPGVRDPGDEVLHQRSREVGAAEQSRKHRGTSSKAKAVDVATFAERVPAPTGVSSNTWLEFLEVAAGVQRLTNARCRRLAKSCDTVRAEGGKPEDVLDRCIEGGYSCISVTWDTMRQRQRVSATSAAQATMKEFETRESAKQAAERGQVSQRVDAELDLIAMGQALIEQRRESGLNTATGLVPL